MKTRLLIIIGIILVGFTSTVYAQYMGGKDPLGTVLESIDNPTALSPPLSLEINVENEN